MFGVVTRKGITRVFGTVFLLLTLLTLIGYECYDEIDLSMNETVETGRPTGEIKIVVHVDKRLLEVYSDGKLHKRYRIAAGRRATPSPFGEWIIVNKDYSDKKIFGTRWLGLNVPWGSYGIHGTNRPWSIGQFASLGCIRMRNQDIEELFEWVPVGTPVRIEGVKVETRRDLKPQMMGPDVVALQIKLKQGGYFTGRADGLFGDLTKEAVERYQQEHNLPVTGKVDQRMRKMLGL